MVGMKSGTYVVLLLFASSIYGARPGDIAVSVWSWRQLHLPFSIE
jgi:hypothetical protein